MPDFRDFTGGLYYINGDGLQHSAKGTTWKNHKYIRIVNGRYIYDTLKNKVNDYKAKKDAEKKAADLKRRKADNFKRKEYYERTCNEVEKAIYNTFSMDQRYDLKVKYGVDLDKLISEGMKNMRSGNGDAIREYYLSAKNSKYNKLENRPEFYRYAIADAIYNAYNSYGSYTKNGGIDSELGINKKRRR